MTFTTTAKMSQKETQHDPPAEEENTTLAGSAMDIVNEQRQEGKISGATVGKFLSRLGKAKVKDVNVDPKLGELHAACFYRQGHHHQRLAYNTR